MSKFRYSFSLSKEDVAVAEPPGTVKLLDTISEQDVTTTSATKDKTRFIPEPSLDPADPLNWPFWQKVAVLISVSLFAFVCNFSSSSIGAAFPLMATRDTPFAKLAQLGAVNLLMGGVSNLWWTPLANTFGRRPVTLLNGLILVLSSMWAGLSARSFNSLLAARMVMGMGQGASETVSADVIGEVFFIHQRGRALGIYQVCLVFGSQAAGIVGGYTAYNLGIEWIHWLNVVLSGVSLLLCFLFQPETMFDRRKALSRTPSRSTLSSGVDEKEGSDARVGSNVGLTIFEPWTFGRSLAIWTVYRPGLVARLLGPFRTLRFPGVWTIVLCNAGLISSLVNVSMVASTLVSRPPYMWREKVGLVGIGGLIGAGFGGLATYALADRIAIRRASKAHGMAEPEDRLPIAFLGLISAMGGCWVYGFCAENPSRYGWLGLSFGIGMVAFGAMQVPSIGLNYLIESYYAVSGDCFVVASAIRSIFAFIWSFVVGEWVTNSGPAEPFGIFGGVLGLLTFLLVAQWWFGKRLRIATASLLPAKAEH